MSANVRIPRGRRGAFATVTALLAVLVFAAGAAEAISLAINRRGLVLSAASVAKFGRDTELSDTVVLIVAIVAFAVGILLLLAAVIPSRRHLVELTESDPNIAAGVTKRSLRRTLTAAATDVDGVSHAKVSGRRRYRVKASTALRDTDRLPELIRSAVTSRLTQLDPAKTRAVRVKLDRKDD